MLKFYREKANLTQAELAKILNYSSPQFVSNIERGISELPIKKYKIASKTLRIPTSVLISHKLKLTEKKLRKAFR